MGKQTRRPTVRDPSGRLAADHRFCVVGRPARFLWLPALDRQAWVAIDRSRARARRRQPRNLQGTHSLAGHRCPRMEANMRRPKRAGVVVRTGGGAGTATSYRRSGTDVRTPWRGQVQPRPRGLLRSRRLRRQRLDRTTGLGAGIRRCRELPRRSSTRPKRPSAASGPEPLCRLVSGDDDTRTNARGEGSFCGAGITAAAGMPRASYRLHSAAELSWLARSTIDPVFC